MGDSKEMCSVSDFIDRGQVQELESSKLLRTSRAKEDMALEKRSPESPGNLKVGRLTAWQSFCKG